MIPSTLNDVRTASGGVSGARTGHGHLRVIRCGPRSVISRAFAASPLKWLTPRNNGPAAWAYASTYGGGLVDGDALRISVSVEPGAMAMLSTQASTKVYRSPSGTSSELTARVAAGGLLVSAPDAVVCFAHARYRQVQEFHLEAGADLVSVDWLSAGRRARGERWAFDEYRNRLRIHVAGELVCHEGVTLRSADADLADRFGRFDALATVALIGPRLRIHAEQLLTDHRGMPPARHADRLSLATPLAGGGCLIRMAGVSLEDVGRAIRDCLNVLPAVLGDDPWARKW